MHALINFVASFGKIIIDLVVVLLSGGGMAFALGLLGQSTANFVGFSEEKAINSGLFWGAIGGLVFAIYNVCLSGVGFAFLASLGMAVGFLIAAWLIWIFTPSVPLPDDYPY